MIMPCEIQPTHHLSLLMMSGSWIPGVLFTFATGGSFSVPSQPLLDQFWWGMINPARLVELAS
jgi:hypothetical protein